jgi:hypothetical protein
MPHMNEQELPAIEITGKDIEEANQLSLHCPICANPVENHVTDVDLKPVICAKCGTLYHRACWEQSGGKCAVLGCGHGKAIAYGSNTSPILKINYTDLPQPALNGRSGPPSKQLKEEQRRQIEALRRPGLLYRLFKWLLDQIRIG